MFWGLLKVLNPRVYVFRVSPLVLQLLNSLVAHVTHVLNFRRKNIMGQTTMDEYFLGDEFLILDLLKILIFG